MIKKKNEQVAGLVSGRDLRVNREPMRDDS